MSGQYDDFIRLPHPDSPKHPRMSLYDRAAQFSPFAALTGHSAAIAETGRLTDQRMELDEYEMARVDAELQRLQAVNGVIQMTDRQCIPIADVFSIEIIP